MTLKLILFTIFLFGHVFLQETQFNQQNLIDLLSQIDPQEFINDLQVQFEPTSTPSQNLNPNFIGQQPEFNLDQNFGNVLNDEDLFNSLYDDLTRLQPPQNHYSDNVQPMPEILDNDKFFDQVNKFDNYLGIPEPVFFNFDENLEPKTTPQTVLPVMTNSIVHRTTSVQNLTSTLPNTVTQNSTRLNSTKLNYTMSVSNHSVTKNFTNLMTVVINFNTTLKPNSNLTNKTVNSTGDKIGQKSKSLSLSLNDLLNKNKKIDTISNSDFRGYFNVQSFDEVYDIDNMPGHKPSLIGKGSSHLLEKRIHEPEAKGLSSKEDFEQSHHHHHHYHNYTQTFNYYQLLWIGTTIFFIIIVIISVMVCPKVNKDNNQQQA